MQVVRKDSAEACLRQALLYLYQENKDKYSEDKVLASTYNDSINIINSVYEHLGDKQLIKNDISKIRELNSMLTQLARHGDPSVVYMAKAMSSILLSLIN